jgi:hypothetical protein
MISAQQKQPAGEQGDRQGGDHRLTDRQDTEDDHDHALDQK